MEAPAGAFSCEPERLNIEGAAAAVQVLSVEFRQAARRLAEPSDQTLPDSRSTSKVRCACRQRCPRYRRLANGCPSSNRFERRV